jgi:hypothetical protein
MVDILLEHTPDDAAKGNDLWLKLAADDFKDKNTLIGRSTYLEQPFSPPPSFDVQHIVELFKTRFCAADDELFRLQSEPVYVRETMKEVDKHPKILKGEIFKRNSLDLVAARAILRCWDWSLLRVEASKFHEDCAEQMKDVRPGFCPPAYDDGLRRLEAAVKRVYSRMAFTLQKMLQELPAFRCHWPGEGSKFKLCRTSDEAFRLDPLFWHLLELTTNDRRGSQPASFHFDRVGNILSNGTPRNKARVNQALYDHIADMATVEEALSAIRYHGGRETLPPGTSKAKEVASGLFSCHVVFELGKALFVTYFNNKELSETVAAFCHLPLPPKSFSRRWLEQTKSLYDGLHLYWENFSARIRSVIPFLDISGQTAIEHLLRHVEITLTEDYKTHMQAEFSRLLQEVEDCGL